MSQQAAALLERRQSLVEQLRAQTGRTASTSGELVSGAPAVAPQALGQRTSAAASAPAPTGPVVGSSPVPVPPATPSGYPQGPAGVPPAPGAPPHPSAAAAPSAPFAPPVAPRPSTLARLGVQGLLVALGALLLAVAGLVFLVFAWDRLGLGGRAAVIAGITAVAMAAAWWLRDRLPETGQAIGAIATVLVLADAWAVRATGLLGTDRWPVLGYLALAAGVCATVLLGFAVAARVRAASMVGSVLAPAAVVVAGAWVSQRSSDPAPFAVALALAAAICAGRYLLPVRWGAERRALLVGALLGWLGAVATALVVLLLGLVSDDGGVELRASTLPLAAVALAGAAAAAWVHVALGVRIAGRDSLNARDFAVSMWRATCSFGVGSAAAATGWAIATIGWREAGWPGRVTFALFPIAAALVALAVAVSTRSRPTWPVARRHAVRGANLAVLVSTVPGMIVTAAVLGGVVVFQGDPAWQLAPGDPIAADAEWHTWLVGWVIAGFVGAAGLVLAGRPWRWATPAAVVLVVAALLVPAVDSRMPVVVAVLGWVVLAAGSLALARRVRGSDPAHVAGTPGLASEGRAIASTGVASWRARLVSRSALGLAAVALPCAVLLSLTSRALTVPTLIAAALLLFAARAAVPAAVRPLLVGASVASVVFAVGAMPGMLSGAVPRVGDDYADGVGPLFDARAAGAAAALLCVAFALAPTRVLPRSHRLERAVGALTSLAFAAEPVAVLLTGSAGGWPSSLSLLGAVAFLLAVVVLAWPVRTTPAVGPIPALVGAALVPPALVSCVMAPRLGQAAPVWRDVVVPAAWGAVVVAFLLVAARVWVDRSDPTGSGVAATEIGVAEVAGAEAAGSGAIRSDGAGRGAAVSSLASLGHRLGAAEISTGVLVVGLALATLVRVGDPRNNPGAWVPTMLLGVAAAALAVPAGRRRLMWVSWVLLAMASAFRLLAADVGVVEAYTLPPALALLAVGAWQLRADPRARSMRGPLWETAPPGLALAVLPSVALSGAGAWQRPSALIVLGALGVAVYASVAGLVSERVRQLILGTAVVAAAGAATMRTAGAFSFDADRAGAARLLDSPLDLEVWTVSAALAVVGAGFVLLGERPSLRSWPALGPGVALLLLPSLVAGFDTGPFWRVATVSLLALGTVLAGVIGRVQAPALIGAAVLTVHAVVQLGPRLAQVVADQPRWIPFAVVGVVLLVLGATYERRLRELRAVQVRIAALR